MAKNKKIFDKLENDVPMPKQVKLCLMLLKGKETSFQKRKKQLSGIK